jgi:2'-5' RNA ligase
MPETAVAVLFPELEPLVGAWRAELTRDGARGMPPHVTLLDPFADSTAVGDALPALETSLATFESFDLVFEEVAFFSDGEATLYLRPNPAEPFVAMTEALVRAFPAWPPYGGMHDEIVPHLTIAHGDRETLERIAGELVGALPLWGRVERAWLVENTAEGWRRHTAFPLRAGSAR